MAATCGFYTSAFNGQKYPRLQLRTIGQLLAGVAIERPSGNVTVDDTKFQKQYQHELKKGRSDVPEHCWENRRFRETADEVRAEKSAVFLNLRFCPQFSDSPHHPVSN